MDRAAGQNCRPPGGPCLRPDYIELIRSCGSAFSSLHRDDDSWEARSIPALGGDYAAGRGDTPEEGMARLWLDLHNQE